MKRTLGILLVVAVLTGSGIAHGIWTQRWGGPELMKAAAEKVGRLPATLPGWTSEEVKVAEANLLQTGAVGHISRKYRNEDSGDTVSVLLLCGQTGPLTAHTPTVCVPNTGLNLTGDERKFTLSSGGGKPWGEFRVADFKGESIGNNARIRIMWSFSENAIEWKAPDNPRMSLAGRPFLFKVFVNRDLPQFDSKARNRKSKETFDEDSCADLLRILLS